MAGNYTMLNCYPEFKILHAEQLIRSLQLQDPADLIDDLANWLRYPNDPSAVTELLSDYDVQGKHVPYWVSNSANLVINSEITKSDFANMIQYLNDQNLLN